MRRDEKVGWIKHLLGSSKAVFFSYIDAAGNDSVGNFVADLSKKEQASVAIRFETFLLQGHIYNKEQFRLLKSSDGIYEFKIDAIRILCFIRKGVSPKSLVLTNAFSKGARLKTQIKKAEKIKKKILALEKEGTLKIQIRGK